VDLVSPEGRTMCCYPLDGHGWATLKASADGKHLYIGNYFNGQLVKLELESGEHIAIADTGVQRSLAGIAEYAGDGRSQRSTQAKRSGSGAGGAQRRKTTSGKRLGRKKRSAARGARSSAARKKSKSKARLRRH
jgi:hypothetical protein